MTNDEMGTGEVQIDLTKLVKQLLRRAAFIIAAAVVCMALAFALAGRGYVPQYTASTLMRAEYPPLAAENEEQLRILLENSGDRDLVGACMVLLTSRGVLEDVIAREDLSYSYQDLSKMIACARASSPDFFQITVTGPNGDEALRISNALADILPEKVAAVSEDGTVEVVDYAGEATAAGSSSGRTMKAALGAVAGAMLAAAVVVFAYLFSGKIHDEDYLAQVYPGTPLLALVPDGKNAGGRGRGEQAVAAGMSAAEAEAYKLLRTNLSFSFPEEQTDRVIGLTSSLADEGKSAAAVNLAYVMAQTGKKVLLVEADMRAPALARRLGLSEGPGLSALLAGQLEPDGVVKTYKAASGAGEVRFDVLAAGAVPPDPSELLASEKMKRQLRLFRQEYDYVLLDLPPAATVTDAVIASHFADGMVVVVRAEGSVRDGLAETMRRLRLANAAVLGFVLCGGRSFAGDQK